MKTFIVTFATVAAVSLSMGAAQAGDWGKSRTSSYSSSSSVTSNSLVNLGLGNITALNNVGVLNGNNLLSGNATSVGNGILSGIGIGILGTNSSNNQNATKGGRNRR